MIGTIIVYYVHFAPLSFLMFAWGAGDWHHKRIYRSYMFKIPLMICLSNTLLCYFLVTEGNPRFAEKGYYAGVFTLVIFLADMYVSKEARELRHKKETAHENENED